MEWNERPGIGRNSVAIDADEVGLSDERFSLATNRSGTSTLIERIIVIGIGIAIGIVIIGIGWCRTRLCCAKCGTM